MDKQVAAARMLRLDSQRIEGAKRRARIALDLAAHHQKLADTSIAQADLLARTWGFEIKAGEVLDS